MARIRTIKPDFFRDEDLQDLESSNPGLYVMLVFAGLWGHCDSEGRFEWKPRSLKLDILPFLEFDFGAALSVLVNGGFLEMYEVDGKKYGEIPTFKKHQRITGKEAHEGARFPAKTQGKVLATDEGNNGETTGKHSGKTSCPGREGKGIGREGSEEGETLGVSPNAPALVSPELKPVWKKWKAMRREKHNAILGEIEEEAKLMELVRMFPLVADQIEVVEFSTTKGAKHLILNGDHKRSRDPPRNAKSNRISRDELYSEVKP